MVMLRVLQLFLFSVLWRASEAFVVHTNGRPLQANGQSQYLGNPQGYDPVSTEQQMGSPNFQQPNVLTGQKIQIQAATSRPVFSVFGFGNSDPCVGGPHQATPSGASQELYNYYNQIHGATSRPYIATNNFQQPQQQQQVYGNTGTYGNSGSQYGNNNNDNGQQYGNGNSNSFSQYGKPNPDNPIKQITGTNSPLQVFQGPDHVPLSMQLSSQLGRPVFANNQQQQQQQQQQQGLYSNAHGQSGVKQPDQAPAHQVYDPYPTPRAPYRGTSNTGTEDRQRPSGYRPLNVGKRSIRMRRQVSNPSSFDPNQLNRPQANGANFPTGYQQDGQQGSTIILHVPSFFTDPYQYQMDQVRPQSLTGNDVSSMGTDLDSNTDGRETFSRPQFFLGASKFGSSQPINSLSQVGAPPGVELAEEPKDETQSTDSGQEVSSQNIKQGGSSSTGTATNQGGGLTSDSKPKPANPSKGGPSFNPNQINQIDFNFFDPRRMISSGRRTKRSASTSTYNNHQGSEFDPSNMKASSFQPSSMNAGNFDPTNGNQAATNQNPAQHPTGQFDPSRLPSNSFDPSRMEAPPRGGLEADNSPPQGEETPAGSQTMFQRGSGNFDPNQMSSGSSFNPGSSGLFDPSAWEEFLG